MGITWRPCYKRIDSKAEEEAEGGHFSAFQVSAFVLLWDNTLSASILKCWTLFLNLSS